MSTKPNVRVSATARESATLCAVYIADVLKQTLHKSGRATLAISGGNTPKPMFQDLAASGLDWSKVHIFWVDERCVPPTSSQSNFKLASETLLSGSGIPAANVHRVFGELPPEDAAQKYITEIEEFFELRPGDLPVFDVLHRGIGDDAHTASLFPGEPLIGDRTGIAAHVWVEKMKMDRVTLLPGVLLKAADTVVEAAGADKAEPIYNVLYGPDDPYSFPCQLATRGADQAIWFLDATAAAKIQAV